MAEALSLMLRSRGLTPARASVAAGMHEGALSAVFRGARELTASDIERVLEGNRIPPGEYFGYLALVTGGQLEPDPLALLARIRGVPRPVDANLAIWLTYHPRPGSGAPLPGLPPLVEEIEKLRLKSREDALERARIWVSTFPARFRGGRKGKAFRAEAVCEFAIALGMWGSVAACLGSINDASFALEHALNLHRDFRLTLGYARLLLWGTSVLGSAGNPEAGITLADRALAILPCLNAAEMVPAALASRAYLASLAGRDVEAARIAEALARNSKATEDQRFAACLLQFNLALAADDLVGCERELMSAKSFLPRIAAHWEIYWRWNQARFESKRNPESAREIFRQLLARGAEKLKPQDRFLIFFDFAAVLDREQDLKELREQARTISWLLPVLVLSPFNLAVVTNILKVAHQRLPAAVELSEARGAVLSPLVSKAPPP